MRWCIRGMSLQHSSVAFISASAEERAVIFCLYNRNFQKTKPMSSDHQQNVQDLHPTHIGSSKDHYMDYAKHHDTGTINFLTFYPNENLTPCAHDPCIFTGEIIPGKPPLYLGIYVDSFVYCSEDPEVERVFEQKLASLIPAGFMERVSYFIGIKFEWTITTDKLSVHLSQPAFTENLIQMAGLDQTSSTTKLTPYRSSLPVDSVPEINMRACARAELHHTYISLVGSLQ